jgi:glyoxylase-like metal-dependent hydrolase (beta-lactamase superfamily II)/rhodanese-related sulfurtransferase
MKIEQIYTGCLAQGAYYIESEGEAAVIDPLREVQPYLERAKASGARVKYVLETHFHADFVSGHLDLSKATGAPIVFGPGATPSFPAHIAADGERISVGKLTLTVLHTPGHTMESVCYLLNDESGTPRALFSGDTLFIGDVGRPDLAQKSGIRQEQLAGLLYESLRNKIMPLPDGITVYPAHGAGSACGKNMSRETSDTLGHQKKTNYALQAMSKEDFVAAVTEGLNAPPQYFPENVRLNREGYESLDTVMKRGTQALSPEAFEAAANETQALLLDTRHPDAFARGFIPNSINIGLDGTFAPWVGTLIPDLRQPILVIAEAGREKEVITRLARVGYDNTIGYLAGGFTRWLASGKEADHVDTADASALAAAIAQGAGVIDVRRQSEYRFERIREAVNLPLDFVNDNFHEVDRDRTWYVHCASGYRSMIYISILKARGFTRLINVSDGFKSIRTSGLFHLETGVPATQKV